jgi:hypothetical protein
MREREDREIRRRKRRSPGSRCSPSLRVGPVGPVDDDGVSLRPSTTRRAMCTPTEQAARAPGVSGGASPRCGGRRMLRQDRWREPPACFAA